MPQHRWVRERGSHQARGLWGSNRTFVDGTTRVADKNGLTQSIVAPQSQVVQGFTRANMPVYSPTENRRLALITYIRSLAVDPELPR